MVYGYTASSRGRASYENMMENGTNGLASSSRDEMEFDEKNDGKITKK